MNFIKKIKDLTSSSKSKSLNDFRKELKQREQTNKVYIEQRKNEDVGFEFQTKGIEAYKNKEFKKSEKYLLQAMNEGFYSPGGLVYIAKIYRKRKDYNSEVEVLENGLEQLKKDKKNNYGSNLLKVQERLSKAREYKVKQENN